MTSFKSKLINAYERSQTKEHGTWFWLTACVRILAPLFSCVSSVTKKVNIQKALYHCRWCENSQQYYIFHGTTIVSSSLESLLWSRAKE